MKCFIKVVLILLIFCTTLSFCYDSVLAADTNQEEKIGRKGLRSEKSLELFRDGTIALCVFSVGYFAIVFEIAPKRDRRGRSYRRENHFELLYLDKKIRKLQTAVQDEADPDNKNDKNFWRLPRRIYLPFVLYFVDYILATVLYSLLPESMVFIFVGTFGLSVWYVSYILKILYSPKWIVETAKRICEGFDEVDKCGGDLFRIYECANIIANTFNVLAEDDRTRLQDLLDIHDAARSCFESIDSGADAVIPKENLHFFNCAVACTAACYSAFIREYVHTGTRAGLERKMREYLHELPIGPIRASVIVAVLIKLESAKSDIKSKAEQRNDFLREYLNSLCMMFFDKDSKKKVDELLACIRENRSFATTNEFMQAVYKQAMVYQETRSEYFVN